MIDKDVIIISNNKQSFLQISGNVFNPQSGQELRLLFTKPDSSSVAIVLIPNNDGSFFTNHGLNQNWPLGDYTIKAVYQDKEVATVSFMITDKPIPPSESQQESASMTPSEPVESANATSTESVEPVNATSTDPLESANATSIEHANMTSAEPITQSQQDTSNQVSSEFLDEKSKPSIQKKSDRPIETISEPVIVPSWIKHNAKWWAQGAINDNDFTSGIGFMIKEDIIKVPQIISEKEKSSFTLGKIPKWIKSNAKWWSEDLISDEDFVRGIEFLIKEGIIQV